MNLEIFCGTIRKCNYVGYSGNTLGKIHNIVVEENVYFIKVCDNGFVRLDELLDDSAKPSVLKKVLPSISEYFVDDLVLVNDATSVINSVYNSILYNSKERIK